MNFSKQLPDREQWSLFVRENTLATPFQLPEFVDFFNRLPQQSALVYSVVSGDALRAVCVVTIQQERGLKSHFSRRAIIYGGPVFTDEAALAELLEGMNADLKKRVIYCETRNFKDYSAVEHVFAAQSWHFVPYLNFQLAFDGRTTDELVSAMKYNRKREIRISLQEGATIAPAQTASEVGALYAILKDLYETRVKLPLPDLAYFMELWQSPTGKVFIVQHNGRVIGGSFCLYASDMWLYTLYYCGLRDYHKKIFPTHLAILAALKFGEANGLKGIDFMGAGKPEEEYGVRKYKSEFGGELVAHGRFLKICQPLMYRIGVTGLNLLKRLKP